MKGILPPLGWCVLTSVGALVCLTVAGFVVVEALATGSLFLVGKAILPLIASAALLAFALANGATLRRRLYYGRGGHKGLRRYRFELCEPIVVSLGPICASGPGLLQIYITSDSLAYFEVAHQDTPSVALRVFGLDVHDLPPAFAQLLHGEEYSLASDSCLIDVPIVSRKTWEMGIELSWMEGMPQHLLLGAINGGRKPLRMDVILTGRFSSISLPDDLLIAPNPAIPIRGFEVVFPKRTAQPPDQRSG